MYSINALILNLSSHVLFTLQFVAMDSKEAGHFLARCFMGNRAVASSSTLSVSVSVSLSIFGFESDLFSHLTFTICFEERIIYIRWATIKQR